MEQDWLDGSGNAIHTIHTYYDADGETVGVTEWDSSDSANATDYEYTYDAGGDMLSSRMAPGDLAQTVAPLVYSGQLSSGTTIDWNNGPVAEPYYGYAVSLAAGQVVTVSLTSSAFHAVALRNRPRETPATGCSTRTAWAAATPG